MASAMEIEITTTRSVIAPKDAVASVNVDLHPLVIMNVSDHWTRMVAQNGKNITVYGALIGKQVGRSVEVMNSFELLVVEKDIPDGGKTVNTEYYQTKEDQFKQVFPDLELIGWYTTGDIPVIKDIEIHKQICALNEGSAIMLKLNSLSRDATLPVKCYESIIDTASDTPATLFIEVPFQLTTEDGERIGIDHVTRISTFDQSGGGESSTATSHLLTQHSAVKMLYQRIEILKSYLQAVATGDLPVDHSILRECSSLCSRLPLVNDANFKQDFYQQCNDAELMSYLGTITQGCKSMSQFVTAFNILHDRYTTSGTRRTRVMFP